MPESSETYRMRLAGYVLSIKISRLTRRCPVDPVYRFGGEQPISARAEPYCWI
jgi:hypothetical protein